jgi:hypothetical protein
MTGKEKQGTTVYNKLVTVAVAFGSLVYLIPPCCERTNLTLILHNRRTVTPRR